MSKEQTVIYTARTSQDAHLLKNLLAEEQIRAIVQGDLLERGSGVGLMGAPTAARVVVAEQDTLRARQIALEFDRTCALGAGSPAAEGAEVETPPMAGEAWPRCPECDAPRSTRCPVCQTAGSDFPPVDMGFIWIPESEDAAKGSPSCSCGPAGCIPGGAAETEAYAADEDEQESAPTMLICPTCDEPFQPEYPRRCEWCGHGFADGVELDLPQGPAEQIDSRVIAVILGLLVLAIALAAYFMFIV